MAKILYGVAGEGFGHSSRSELIGKRLVEAGILERTFSGKRGYSRLSHLCRCICHLKLFPDADKKQTCNADATGHPRLRQTIYH